MDKKEYEKKMNKIIRDTLKAKDKLNIDYAMQNNQVEIGDTIEDHMGKGIVLDIRTHINLNNVPACYYKCTNLTKKGLQSKTIPIRNLYQCNLVGVEKENKNVKHND